MTLWRIKRRTRITRHHVLKLMSWRSLIPYSALSFLFFATLYWITKPDVPDVLQIGLLRGRAHTFGSFGDWNNIFNTWTFEFDGSPEDVYAKARPQLLTRGWKENAPNSRRAGVGPNRKTYGYSYSFDKYDGGRELTLMIDPRSRFIPHETTVWLHEWKHRLPPVWERFEGRRP